MKTGWAVGLIEHSKYVSIVGSRVNSSQARKASQADIHGGTLESEWSL